MGTNEKIAEIFSELIDYTIDHFQDEESIMAAMGYPDLEKHKKQHNGLTRQVLELQKSFREGSATISYEVLDFLSQWPVSHIMNSDKKIVEYQATFDSKNPEILSYPGTAKTEDAGKTIGDSTFALDIDAIEKTFQAHGEVTRRQVQAMIDALKAKDRAALQSLNSNAITMKNRRLPSHAH